MKTITLTHTVLEPVEKVWDYYTTPEHIVKWNFANDKWHCPKAENDLRNGGSFNFRMEARDGSFGYDYAGVYEDVMPLQYIKATLNDGRPVEVSFNRVDPQTTEIVKIFQPESQTPVEMQRDSWKHVLDNFGEYVENN